MALSFYLQCIMGVLIHNSGDKITNNHIYKYMLATAHPVVRLPVFFMGISAGVLCIRIQQGDLDAFQSE